MRAAAPAEIGATIGIGTGADGAWRVTWTRKIVVATWWRISAGSSVVEREGFLPELVERILLRVAAEADAAAHVVELGQVLHPQRVDRAQQHEALDGRPVLGADLGFLGGERRVDQVADVLDSASRPPTLPERRPRSAPSPSMPIALSAAARPSRFQSSTTSLAAKPLDEVLDLLVQERPGRCR